MQNLLGVSLWFILPIILGMLAIALPFWSYRKEKKDGALALGIINSVFCGFSVLLLVGTLVFDWYPTFLPHIIVGLGCSAAFVLVLQSGVPKKKKPNQSLQPTAPSRRG